MDIELARAALHRALDPTAPKQMRFRAARQVLIDGGITACQLTPRPGMALDDVIRAAAEAPASDARRGFAVLLVHALGVDGLLPARSETERLIQSFLERALLNPLRRAGYPFDGTAYDKRQALAGLHATIEEHLRPPEPSIPRWLHGVGRRADE